MSLDGGLFEEAESKTYSMKSSNTSNKKEYDDNMIIKSTKYEEPKYEEVHNTYEVLKPITKHVLELPIEKKKKIKIAKTIIQKEIIVNNEEELNRVLNDDNLYNEEIPLPTKSAIQNLIKDSVVVSYNNNTINNNIHSNPYKSQQIKYKSNIQNKINKKSEIKNNENNKNIEKQSIIYKDKNYIETYFHDDDIPKPEVYEGNALEFSKKSIESNNSNNSNKNIKNLLDKLPIEHTVILSKEQKIDMSKVQKDNMLKKSSNTEINSSNIQSNIYNNKIKEKPLYYKSQAINYNNNKNYLNNINNNIITNSMQNYPQKKNINEIPLPEIDNNININNEINKTKIKPVMEISNETKTNKIINQSRSSFISENSGNGSFVSVKSVHNPFDVNNNTNNI